MSVKLEQDGLYILPNALEGTSYVILQATQTSHGWQLFECHALPFGSEQFKSRTLVSDEQLLRYDVDSSGALLAHTDDTTQQQTNFSLASLSLIGYLRDGQFIPAPEGL